MVLGYTPTVCLATGIVNLYTVMALQLALVGLRCLGFLSPAGVQGLRDGVTLSGRVCIPGYVLDRTEGFSLAKLRYLVPPWFCGVQAFAMGSPLGGSSLRVVTSIRSDRRPF